MTSKLEPYDLSEEKRNLLEQVFSRPASAPVHEVYKKRPESSVLRFRVMFFLSPKDLDKNRHSPAIMEAVLRSIERCWDKFGEGLVAPNEFMHTPSGAMYEVVAIEGKGRGMVASRDIKAGEIILQESPLLLLPPRPAMTVLFFLTLPQQALEAFLLLDNANTDYNHNTLKADVPIHRLIDLIEGIRYTNTFTASAWPASFDSIGVLLLRGALFNHSDKSNMYHAWNRSKEMYVFMARRDIKKGDALEINYLSPALRSVPSQGQRD
ncbi:hypothetical protein V8E51_002902 [Hyaloscypha variabilis]